MYRECVLARPEVLTRTPILIALAASVAGPLFAQSPEKSGWVLTFSDEFEGKDLDFAKWAPHAPGDYEHPREAQVWVPGAIDVSGGQAHITALRSRGFTSGIMTTYGSFAQLYGRFEIRCRIPPGRGLESKFGLLPVPSGEVPAIDIVDVIGSAPTTALFANRWGDPKTERSYSGSYQVSDLSNGFHVMAIEWDKDKIVWLVDGKERFRSVTGIPHQPMYLAVSLAVGGPQAKWPDDTTHFPAVFDVDYVRVYGRP